MRAVHVDVAARDGCYAPDLSYGMICVGCGCCGPYSPERTRARLRYWQQCLQWAEDFDEWFDDPELRATQERNLAADKRRARRRVRYYRKRVEEAGQ